LADGMKKNPNSTSKNRTGLEYLKTEVRANRDVQEAFAKLD
jgi:hypothetical protein